MTMRLAPVVPLVLLAVVGCGSEQPSDGRRIADPGEQTSVSTQGSSVDEIDRSDNPASAYAAWVAALARHDAAAACELQARHAGHRLVRDLHE